MGTRADFYVGRGRAAEWLGSIPYDGYPDGIDAAVLKSKTEAAYRKNVAAFLADPDNNATLPAMGWPWPWDDSNTSDYAYAFDGGKVWGNGFGHGWFDATKPEPHVSNECSDDCAAPHMADARPTEFPNMKERKAVTMGKRSGLLVLTAK